MEIELAINRDVMMQHFDLLITASAASGATPLTEEGLKKEFQRLWTILLKIAKRYLSDSPSRDEKRQFCIAVLEEALRIAKGEK